MWSAAKLSALTRATVPSGSLDNQSLAAISKHRDSHKHMNWGSPVCALNRCKNIEGMGQLKYSFGSPRTYMTAPSPCVEALVTIITAWDSGLWAHRVRCEKFTKTERIHSRADAMRLVWISFPAAHSALKNDEWQRPSKAAQLLSSNNPSPS